jgi:predicted nucleotidyltransferase
MRSKKEKKSLVDALLPEVRQDILGLLLLQFDQWWYMSDLAFHLNRSVSSLQRELSALTEVGILERKRDGNRVYYRADTQCPIFPELSSILTKTSGLVDQLKEALKDLEYRIRVAAVFGSLARSEEHSGSDIDLLVVGDLGLGDLVPALRETEVKLSREINPIVYTEDEYRSKVHSEEHFLTSILGSERLFLIGDEHELERITG